MCAQRRLISLPFCWFCHEVAQITLATIVVGMRTFVTNFLFFLFQLYHKRRAQEEKLNQLIISQGY